MDSLILDYIELLKQLDEMDLNTLNDIKDIGNIKKRKTDLKLKVLSMLPKCDSIKNLKDKIFQDNLDLQSNLAYWTFLKLQETLDCQNLDLLKELETNEEKLKIYDYFEHLVLIHKDDPIRNVIGVEDKLVFFNKDNKMFSDNYKLHKPLSRCNDRSFLKVVNTILKDMGIDQSINLETKKLENTDGPLLYSDINQTYYMCDLEVLTNLMILFKDGSIRNVQINNWGIYKESTYNSLREKKSMSELSRKKTK
ncbi:MAG: hypothetical protein J6B98_03535 [Bacilli bacterium]|nr:hypothetical protein [Bacilli bacterium]